MDFIAIGDTVVDAFIKLEKDRAQVACDERGEHCMLSMAYGDKLPFESATVVPGVGNSANAAVSAARLGLSSGILTWLGGDRLGKDCLDSFEKEGVAKEHIDIEAEKLTNSHYVLWYPPDRTILIKHEAYDYAFPPDLPVPKAVYLSSVGAAGLPMHDTLANWLEQNPSVLFAFQPGTFQMSAGMDQLARLYARADVFIANKEEYQRILASQEEDVKQLMQLMRAKGPKRVFLTDGGNGAYALEDGGAWKIGLYPDGKEAYERTGAGDAFASTAVVALLLGKDMKEALAWGPVNSASVVQKIGAREGLLSRDELLKSLTAAPPEYKAEAF